MVCYCYCHSKRIDSVLSSYPTILQDYIHSLMTTAIVNEEDASLLIREYNYSQVAPDLTYRRFLNCYTTMIFLGILAYFYFESICPILVSAMGIIVKLICVLYQWYKSKQYRRNFYDLISQLQQARDLFVCILTYYQNRNFVPKMNSATEYIRSEKYFLKLFLDNLVDSTQILQRNLLEISRRCPTKHIAPDPTEPCRIITLRIQTASKEMVLSLYEEILCTYRKFCSNILCLVAISYRTNYKHQQFYWNQKNFNAVICTTTAEMSSLVSNLRKEFVQVQLVLSEFIYARPFVLKSRKMSITSSVNLDCNKNPISQDSWGENCEPRIVGSKISFAVMTESRMALSDTSEVSLLFEDDGIKAELDRMFEILTRWKCCTMFNDLTDLEPLCNETVEIIWQGMKDKICGSSVVNQMRSHSIAHFILIFKILLGDSEHLERDLQPGRTDLYWASIKKDCRFIINAFLEAYVKALQNTYYSANILDNLMLSDPPTPALAQLTRIMQDDMDLCETKLKMFIIVFKHFNTLVNYSDEDEEINQVHWLKTNDCGDKNEAHNIEK